MKRLLWLSLILALVLTNGGILSAQESMLIVVQIEGVSFSLDNTLALGVGVQNMPADPVDQAFPGGPLPAHRLLTLIGYGPLRGADEYGGVIRVVKTADLKGLGVNEDIYLQLQKLLTEKPDLSAYMKPDMAQHSLVLPHLYPPPAAQILRARAAYVETDHMLGIRYLAAYAQDVSPLSSEQIMYLYEGISTDGNYYVSAQFRFKTGLFSDEVAPDFNYERFAAGLEEYLQTSIDTLNQASDDEINPALFAMDDLIKSFRIDSEGSTGIQGINWKLKAILNASADVFTVEEPERYTFLITATQMTQMRVDCNQMRAPAMLEGASFVIDMTQAQTTLVGCPEDSLAAPFTEALAKVTGFRIEGSTLMLDLNDGGALHFGY